MKKKLSLIALMAVMFFGYSQETAPVKEEFKSNVPITDRGAYTRPGSNINKGLQLELGYNYDWVDSKNNVFKTDVMTPIAGKLRLGLSKYIELDFAIRDRKSVV